MDIRQKYAYKLLEKKAKKVSRQVILFNFSKGGKVGILWHIDDIKGYEYSKSFFSENGFEPQYLCYREKNGELAEPSFNFKELNWVGFPKSDLFQAFIDTEFDLLMNISVIDSFPLLVATALSKAKYKCGWTNRESYNYFDLMVDVSKNPDSKYLVEQQLYYLEQLTKNSKKDE